MNQYRIVIYWSDEDKAFIAEVPELPGCMADGPTRRKALANVEIIIQEWLETARDLGRAIPKPQGRLLSVAEAAHRLGLGTAMVRRYCSTGDLPAKKISRDWVIGERDLDKFAEKIRSRGRPKHTMMAAQS